MKAKREGTHPFEVLLFQDMLMNGGPVRHDPDVCGSSPLLERRLATRTCVTAVLIVLLAAQVHAHVFLDRPNGGEVLEVGSVYKIVWGDEVSHGPADYDLWYSTTGPDGPWITIAKDLPPSGSDTTSYDWLVPDAPSNRVRVRVQQDNADVDYLAVSGSDLAIVSDATVVPVVLDAEKDASIYEEGNGTDANGSGSYLFTGRTAAQGGSAERRALLSFPIAASIPEGSTIASVSLEVTMSKTISGAQVVGLHRLLEGWSEGPSNPSGNEGGGATGVAGDVTWIHREFPDSLWSTPGAAFVQSASATLQVADVGGYTFSSTPQLVDDVQDWLDDPSSNHGWVLVVDAPPTGSAKRFDSRENATASNRPKLTISYESTAGKPTAAFSFTPANPRPGEDVSFIDDSSGDPTSWQWNFGDGEISQEQNPTHAYTTAGSKTVTLVVSNTSGNDTVVKEVSVGSTVLRPSRRVAPTP
jgi:hypothetical protein